MIYLYGNIFNLKKNDSVINRQTGEITSPPSFTVELLCQEKASNGEISSELMKIKIKDLNQYDSFKPFVGKSVLLHVGKMEGKRAKVEGDAFGVRGADIYYARPDTFPIPFTMPESGSSSPSSSVKSPLDKAA